MDSIRILHFADTHLDCCFSGIGSTKGNRRREELREAFKGIVRIAAEQKVDMVVAAGDLFEHQRAAPDTINFIKRELSSISPTPIFVAPGNHDPIIPDSPYRSSDWPANVHIFGGEGFTHVERRHLNAVITGMGHTSFMDDRHPLKDLQIEKDGRIRILLLHGSDMTSVPPGCSTQFPFKRDELLKSGGDYVALGHYHSFREISGPDGRPLACYPGCPEGMGFDEEGERCALLVEVSKGVARVERVRTNKRAYITHTLDCTGFRTRDEIVEAINEAADEGGWDGNLVRVRLRGEADPDMEIARDEIISSIEGRFFHVTILDETEPSYDIEELARERGIRGEFVKRMKASLEAADEAQEVELLKAALRYGLDAFTKERIRLR